MSYTPNGDGAKNVAVAATAGGSVTRDIGHCLHSSSASEAVLLTQAISKGLVLAMTQTWEGVVYKVGAIHERG